MGGSKSKDQSKHNESVLTMDKLIKQNQTLMDNLEKVAQENKDLQSMMQSFRGNSEIGSPYPPNSWQQQRADFSEIGFADTSLIHNRISVIEKQEKPSRRGSLMGSLIQRDRDLPSMTMKKNSAPNSLNNSGNSKSFLLNAQSPQFETLRHAPKQARLVNDFPKLKPKVQKAKERFGAFPKNPSLPEFSDYPIMGPYSCWIDYPECKLKGVYHGQYKEGRRHGFGVFVYSDGVAYYGGFWYNDKRHGYGVSIDHHGNLFCGEFILGKPQGFGRMEYANGDIFEGSFRDWRHHGSGVLTCADNTKYEGEWRSGKKHGLGLLTDKDGQEIAQEWANGKFVKEAKVNGM